MLIDDIKARFKQAMKARLEVEREILRVAIGDITTRDATSDEDVQAVLRKLLKSNEETLGHGVSDDERAKLEQENQVLREFLPRTLDEVQIVEALQPVAEQIRAAGNDGQATGVAMKQLKSTGAVVEGKTVSAAVRRMRS
ncbi:MAG: GatB/YqeY domain-containing protein [Myxococcales bacterium]|nr:GatB/YqeY domain-containing protein [Myxococcales bacterium]